MADTQYMLSTIDNPYDPFDNFDQWFIYDSLKGYNSCNYLARVYQKNVGLKRLRFMTEEDEHIQNEKAIDEIVLNDPTGMYIKVTKTT